MPFCKKCGTEANENAVVCLKCGASLVEKPAGELDNPQTKQWLVVLLLCIFLGGLGVHRFYVGKTGTGVVQLLTCGGCGIWALIDFIMILTGNFTDAKGNPIKNS